MITKKNESTVSDENKVFVSSLGGKLDRNNNGVAFRKDGTPIRFGLGNESAKIHAVRRSSDQIGILPVVITPDMVGKTIGVFLAVEDKKFPWTYKATEHEVGQQNYIDHVNRLGGIGCFAQCTQDISNAILNFHMRFHP